MKFIEDLKQMNRNRLVIWIMCFIFVIMAFFMLLGLRDAQECMNNPFVYGAGAIINDDTGGIRCSCNFDSYDYAGFDFDNESMEVRGD